MCSATRVLGVFRYRVVASSIQQGKLLKGSNESRFSAASNSEMDLLHIDEHHPLHYPGRIGVVARISRVSAIVQGFHCPTKSPEAAMTSMKSKYLCSHGGIWLPVAMKSAELE
jgi:hypothetical protein